MLIPAISSRWAELWGSFAPFSTATAPSVWGVSINTSFDWVKYSFITFLDLLFATAAHTSITSTQDAQDGNCFPAPGLDRTDIQHQMGLVSVHQWQRLSTNMNSRTKHWGFASFQCLQCLTQPFLPIGDWFRSRAFCRGVSVFCRHWRWYNQKTWTAKESSGLDQLNLS